MNELPLNTGACKWVAAALKRGLTDIEKELVTILCSALGTGPWNVHQDWSIMKECGYGASMSVPAHRLCTIDNSGLTRLVFAAHDRCCRLEVKPAGPRRVSIRAWKRERTGGLAERHPTLEDAVDDWRLYTMARMPEEPDSCHKCGATSNLEHDTKPGRFICSGCIPFGSTT